MKNYQLKIISALLVLLIKTSFSNAQGFQWAQGQNGGYMVSDVSNNTITASGLIGTIDFDAGPNTFNLTSNSTWGYDIVVHKRDAQGNFIWAKQFGPPPSGGAGVAGPGAVAMDALGNIYLASTFQDSIDADPGTGVHLLKTISADIFIVKLNPMGELIWAKSTSNIVPNGGAIFFGDMNVDKWGNVFIGCSIAGTVDADPGPGTDSFTTASSLGNDILIEKLDSAGNYIWGRSMGGSGVDRVHSLQIDSADNIYFTGFFDNTVDFDPGPGTISLTSLGDHDVYVGKMDSSGTMLWAKQVGGSSEDQALAITVDSAGSAYVTGHFKGTADFDPGPNTHYITTGSFVPSDVFVFKLTNNGDYAWAHKLSCGGRGFDITVDPSANIYMAGEFSGSPDFDPGPAAYTITSGGQKDGFIYSLDSAANFRWAASIGGYSSNDEAGPNHIALDHAGNVYAAGGFSGSVDFDPGPNHVFLPFGPSFTLKLCSSSSPVPLTASADTACYGQTIILTTADIPGAAYIWTRDGTIIPGSSSDTLHVSGPGIYDVTITGVGCSSTSNKISTHFLTVLQPSIVSLYPGVLLPLPLNQPLTFTANFMNTWGSNPYIIVWSKNGLPFDTAYNSNTIPYIQTDNGYDTITAVLSLPTIPCADTAMSAYIAYTSGVGIEEAGAAAMSISVYPNPALSQIMVSGTKEDDELSLTDVAGRVVKRWKSAGDVQRYDISSLQSGYYLLKIEDKEGKIRGIKPVIKQ